MFFAAVPHVGILRRLRSLDATLGDDCGRAVPEDKLHMTLLFMPEVRPELEERLLAVAASVPAPCWSLSFNSLAHWAGSSVMVLLASEVAVGLRAWQGQLATAVTKIGIASDKRLWQPHVTLRRGVTRRAEAASVAAMDWQLQSFSLFASEYGRYEPLGRWPAVK